MKLLNIGCGANFHPAWTNIDMVSSSPHVVAHDIRKGLPFVDASFDVVYHSHVIEHLAPHDAAEFLRECVRVLRPEGHLRVATPDLESMARVYLERLTAALSGEPGAKEDHRWMVLELFDQMVRSRPGGEMKDFLLRPDLPNREFILSRIGQEAKQFWEVENSTQHRQRLRSFTVLKLARLASRWWQELVAASIVLLSGPSGRNTYREGLFRTSGEIHRWLYDRLSLATLLDQVGLNDIRPCAAGESRIPGFSTYQLDVVQGRTRKPDSLFMEGSKPR